MICLKRSGKKERRFNIQVISGKFWNCFEKSDLEVVAILARMNYWLESSRRELG
jgi:hypothetical protein